jgi:hypothetical protein
MNKPNHPEGVEGSDPLHYPTPEEIGKFHAIMEELRKLGFIVPIVNNPDEIPPYQLTSDDLAELQDYIDEITRGNDEDTDEQT